IVRGMGRGGTLLRLWEERVAHAVLAVHIGGVDRIGDERPRAPRVHRDVVAPDLLERVERVLDLLVERNVAVADRDRLELRVRVEQRDQKRGDVVAGGVRVDDQTGGDASLLSSSARVGSPGTTPACSTMCAPAAQPQRTASSSSTPSASATANAAVNASPAPVVSTTVAGKAGTR